MTRASFHCLWRIFIGAEGRKIHSQMSSFLIEREIHKWHFVVLAFEEEKALERVREKNCSDVINKGEYLIFDGRS